MAYISGPAQCFYVGSTGSGGTPVWGSGGAGSTTYVGSTQSGWEIREIMHNRPVQDDLFGLARPDAILAGADYEVTGLSVEFDKLQSTGLFNSQIPTGFVNTTVGFRMRDLAGSLVITMKPFTPASVLIGASNSYIVYCAALANDLNIMLASSLRECPVTFWAFPAPVVSYYGGTALNVAYGIIPTPSGCSWITGY